MVIFSRVAGKPTRPKAPGRPPQENGRDWRVASRNRRIFRMAGLRGWICETYSVLLWGPGCRKDLSKVGVNKSSEEMWIANKNISSLVIDRLSNATSGGSISVAYLYCDFQTQKSQVTARILASLLKQVVCGLEVIPAEIDHAFQKAKQGSDGRGLSVSETLKLLPAALRSHKRTFICIDALDEYVAEHRPEFLRSLRSIVRDSPNARLFATGRPHIQAELEEHHGKALRIILFKPVKGDITRYLEMKLQDDAFREEMDSELRQDIMKVIPDMISEMYVNKAASNSPSY